MATVALQTPPTDDPEVDAVSGGDPAIGATPLPPPPPPVPIPVEPTPDDIAETAIANEGAAKVEAERIAGEEAAARLAAKEQAERDRVQAEKDYERAKEIAEKRLGAITQKHKDFKFHDYFEGRAGDEILAHIGTFFGAFGALAGAPNEFARRLENKIQRHYDRQKLELQKIETEQEWERQGVVDIEARRKIAMAELDHKTARQLNMIADQYASMASTNRGKLRAAEAQKEEAKYREAAAKRDEQAKKDLAEIGLKQAQAERAKAETAFTLGGKGKRRGGGGGAGSPAKLVGEQKLAAMAKAGASTDELLQASIDGKLGIGLKDIKTIQADARAEATEARKDQGVAVKGSEKRIDFDEGIRSISTLISQIEKDHSAWDEYKRNALSWERTKDIRGGKYTGAIVRLMGGDVSPEQGLRTPGAKTLFQRQEKLNTSIAKSFGGVITEGDRAAASANQANFALSAQEKVAQLKEMRANLLAKFKVATGQDWSAETTAAAGTKQLKLKDGTIATFDANGKRL